MLKVMSEHLVRDRKVTGAFSCGSLGLVTGYRNRLVFFIMLSGCFENCLPWRFALRFALVVAAYSPDVRALIAASGRYRSPVTELFLPLLVRQFWSLQFFRDR